MFTVNFVVLETGMSLLNKALRKRNKELQQTKKITPFRKSPKRHVKGNKKIFIAIFSILVASSLTIIAIWQFFFQPESLLKKPQEINTYVIKKKFKINSSAIAEANKESKVPVSKELSLKSPIADSSEQQPSQKEVKIAEKDKPAKYDNKKEIKALKIAKAETKKIKSEKKTLSIQKASAPAQAKKAEDLFYNKALSYHRRNDLQNAIQMYLEVLNKNPEHYDALFNLASAYIKTSSFSEAYPKLIKLKERDPENPVVLLNLAITQIGLGIPQKAIASLDLAENLKDAPMFEIYLHRGVALSQLNKLNEAIIWYKRAEELHPNYPRLLFNIAVIYDKQQQYKKALRYYESFLKNDLSTSPSEKKELESRIRVIKAYIAG